MSQSRSPEVLPAGLRVLRGDLGAVCDLSEVEVLENAQGFLMPLINAVRSCNHAAVESKAAGLLAALSAKGEPQVFAAVGRVFLERVQHASCSHDWSSAENSQVAKFYAINLLSITRLHHRSAYALSVDALNTYLSIHRYSFTGLAPQCSFALQQTVLQRLDYLLSMIFRSGSREFQMKWLLSLGEKASSPETSIAVFASMSGMLKDVHQCRSLDALDILTSMFAWLPGVDRCLPPANSDSATPILRLVLGFTGRVPEEFWGASDAGLVGDVPPWIRWWQIAFKLCYDLQPTPNFFALIVATLQVKSLGSRERVMALWRSLFLVASPERKNAFRQELSQWLSLIDDDRLSASISLIFEIPLGPANISTLNGMMLKAMHSVNSSLGAIIFTSIVSHTCPAYLTAILPLLPQLGDHAGLVRCVADIIFDSAHITVHPSEAFTVHESLLMYCCQGGKAALPDAYGAGARQTFELANVTTAPMIAPLGGAGGCKRRREGDGLGPAMEMLRRVEEIIRMEGDGDVREAVLSRLRAMCRA